MSHVPGGTIDGGIHKLIKRHNSIGIGILLRGGRGDNHDHQALLLSSYVAGCPKQPQSFVVKVNGNYLKLKAGYLFPEIGRRVKAFSSANPEAQLIRLGIGDVTEPLPQACRDAMKSAIDEMGTAEGFHGYGPEQGYGWLR